MPYHAKQKAAFDEVKWWLLTQRYLATNEYDRQAARDALEALQRCELALALQVLAESTERLQAISDSY